MTGGDGTDADNGDATIDVVGDRGVPTAASIDGSHIYADDGVYTVAVTVIDDDGGVARDTFLVAVGNVNPTLTVADDQMVDEGATLSITNIGSILDPGFDNPALSTVETFTYSIDWGDGTNADTGDATIDTVGDRSVPTAASFDGSHIYADDGTYTVAVTVIDDDGGVARDTFLVTVGNVNPTLTVANDQSVDEGATLSITSIGSILDPGFDNPALSTVETFTYSIDWGDGTDADTGDATIDTIGDRGVPTAASFDGSHIYADDGIYTVAVTVIDDDGGVARDTFLVTVGNVNPTLTVANDQSVDEGATLSITSIGSILDPGFDNPALSTVETFTYSIDWGDGTDADTGDATIDTIGDRGVPTAASFDGSHIYADDGIYTVAVTVIDDDGGVARDTFLVTVGNVNPTLTVADDQNVDEGATLSITNIGSILDPGFDNPALSTVETFTYSIDWGDGTDADTGDATIDMVGDRGVPTAASFDGTHIYADDGVYTVAVTVIDDDGGVARDTFLVTVGNVNPTLTVADDQSVDEGATLSITNIGSILDPGFDNPERSTVETFTYSIDWGDGTDAENGDATIDTVGDRGVPTAASFDGTHIYADDGVYTVAVTVTDDDGGVDVETLLVTVNNVAPVLTGTDSPLSVDEGEIFSLGSLGVGLSDPGFDNAANPSGATEETFTGFDIDWGDGTSPTPVDVVGRVSGSRNVLTTADFDHAPHAYADNGTYTVTVRFSDDDGGSVAREFTIVVDNVAPTLTLTDESFSIDEGDTLSIPALGTFTDPGFDNALAPGGATLETFTYTIDWGDGTVETGQLPATRLSGSQGELTTGTLADSHLYADNDADNLYTITVTLTDDDGGSHTQSIVVEVLNVNPTLDPIAATDVDRLGNTMLDLSFADPGADSFQVLVDWGDQLSLPPDQRFVVETVHVGPTPQSFTLGHNYAGPPNPANPTADIIIRVQILDDDFGTAGVMASGESNIEFVAIGQPGIEDRAVVFDLTSDLGGGQFQTIERSVASLNLIESAPSRLDTSDIRTGGGDLSATSERYFELRVVYADGELSEPIRLKDEALDDLAGLLKRLPDNHYQIFLVRTENNSRRLVIDVAVRDGRAVDPSDDSDGTRDRPPTIDEALDMRPEAVDDGVPAEGAGQPLPERVRDAVEQPTADPAPTSAAATLTVGGLAMASWRHRLAEAFADGKTHRWRKHRLAAKRRA